MNRIRASMRWALLCAVVAALASPAGATTMIRMGLDELVGANQTVVVGQVTNVRSYWNADHSFILSDVSIQPTDVLKGQRGLRRAITVTVMGGTVDDVTTLIVAGPELVVGSEYVLFLNPEDLPGTPQVRTVRDLSQGIFDVLATPSGKRAISQATRHDLLPDAKGLTQPPGGEVGIALDEMVQKVRELAGPTGTSIRNR